MLPMGTLQVNKDALAELPPDVRNAFLGVMESYRNEAYYAYYNEIGPAIMSGVYEFEFTLKAVPQPMLEEMRGRAYEAIWKPWVERMGPAGAEAFNEVAKALIAGGYTVPGYTPY
jgi:TRAP-type C4-dicarboxylate transport system substrate-binding protein